MPPKEKGKKEEVVIDGVKTNDMTREQLEKFALKLREECDREREERNYFQIERDKLRTYWELTKDQLDEARAQLRNKDRDIEENKEKNADEIKLFKQKVKHLCYEHQNAIAELRAEAMVAMKLAQDDHNNMESQLLKDKTDLKNKLNEQELAFQNEFYEQKMVHSEDISNIRNKFDLMAKETELKYEKKFANLRNDLGIKHRMEMSEVEERKNRQINDLMKDHEKAFNELKNYYNDITLNNLALISSLKEQMELQLGQLDRMGKQLSDTMAENKRLVEPLKQAKADAKELRRQMQNYEKDKMSLHNTKIMLNKCQKEFDDLKWENEALELRFEQLTIERNQLHDRFVNAVLELQQKTGLKNVLLQKRINTLGDSLEQRDAMLSEMAATVNLAPQELNTRLEELLKRKNTTIQDLQYELARVSKMHDDLLQTYEGKLQQFGIPREELGFIPLRATKTGPNNLGRGPAGLITKNK